MLSTKKHWVSELWMSLRHGDASAGRPSAILPPSSHILAYRRHLPLRGDVFRAFPKETLEMGMVGRPWNTHTPFELDRNMQAFPMFKSDFFDFFYNKNEIVLEVDDLTLIWPKPSRLPKSLLRGLWSHFNSHKISEESESEDWSREIQLEGEGGRLRRRFLQEEEGIEIQYCDSWLLGRHSKIHLFIVHC